MYVYLDNLVAVTGKMRFIVLQVVEMTLKYNNAKALANHKIDIRDFIKAEISSR